MLKVKPASKYCFGIDNLHGVCRDGQRTDVVILVSHPTFCYSLPIKKVLPNMPKILIIEDDTDVRELLVTSLEGEGFETLQAENGVVGVQMASTRAPDLILCDLRMPELDGYGTLAELRKQQETSAIPFIFLTGMTDRKNVRQGMELGADDYLEKPITVPELVAAINTRLQKRIMLTQQADKRLEELRASISLSLPHEIRTPLSGIMGFAEVLRDDCSNLKPTEITEMAAMILKSASRLGQLMENFLSYAQLRVYAADPQYSGVFRNAHSVMMDFHIEEVVRKKVKEADRLEDLALSLKGGEVAISNQHMRRAVEELVDNALKYSKKGTPVEVTTKQKGVRHVLTVSDRGVGMRRDQIAEIGAYTQFNRKNREHPGTGLGLAIIKQLVELYGGSLLIESEIGKGTTMRIELPKPSAT